MGKVGSINAIRGPGENSPQGGQKRNKPVPPEPLVSGEIVDVDPAILKTRERHQLGAGASETKRKRGTKKTGESLPPFIFIEEPSEPKPAEMKPLTPYNEEFFIDKVNDGESVLIGDGFTGKLWLKCDWSSFEEHLKKVTPENLDQLFKSVNGLQEQAPELNEKERKILNGCWRATQKAQQLLGPPGKETSRNFSFDKFPGNVKPLSQCKGEAVCSEYALLAHHILQKAGIKSSVVIGAHAANPETDLPDRHTYLVLDNGKLVFDPVATAGKEQCWHPELYKPETPLTAQTLREMSTDLNAPPILIKCRNVLSRDVRYYGSGA